MNYNSKDLLDDMIRHGAEKDELLEVLGQKDEMKFEASDRFQELTFKYRHLHAGRYPYGEKKHKRDLLVAALSGRLAQFLLGSFLWTFMIAAVIMGYLYAEGSMLEDALRKLENQLSFLILSGMGLYLFGAWIHNLSYTFFVKTRNKTMEEIL